MDIRLRPHHGMCFQFYNGKGYSEEFTENMDDLLGRLNGDKDLNISQYKRYLQYSGKGGRL